MAGGSNMGDGRTREDDLQAIGDVLDYWLKWVVRKHKGDVTPDTHVMFGYENAPPKWPTVGQLKRWLEVIRDRP